VQDIPPEHFSDGPHVIKVGGSLLGWPNLCTAFHHWCETQPDPQKKLVIVGGGKIIDAVRELDQIHKFQADAVHWECVRLLSNTARLAASILGGLKILDSPQKLHEFKESSDAEMAILDLAAVSSVLNLPTALPHTWDTTTDALAAQVARIVGAAKLTLLKSTDPPATEYSQAVAPSPLANTTSVFRQWECSGSILHRTQWLKQLSAMGFIDASIVLIAADLPPIAVVNLRS